MRNRLPEIDGYIRADPQTAGSLTHREAGYVVAVGGMTHVRREERRERAARREAGFTTHAAERRRIWLDTVERRSDGLDTGGALGVVFRYIVEVLISVSLKRGYDVLVQGTHHYAVIYRQT